MKMFGIFVAAMLMLVCNTVASDSVEWVNVWDYKEVNKNNFTVVAEGGGYVAGALLRVTITIESQDGSQVSDTVLIETK